MEEIERESPKVLAKKKAYYEKIMREKYPNSAFIIDPEADMGNMNWMYTASLLASGDPEKIAEANRLFNTPTIMTFFDAEGHVIEFTEEDDPDPNSPNAAL